MAGIVRLQHVSIPMPADGHAAARQFYSGVLGMTEIPQPRSLTHNSVVWFSAGPEDQEVHLFVDEPPQVGSVNQHLCLQVDDLPEMLEQLAQHGIVPEETVAITNRPRVFVSDPFENRLELAQVLGKYD